ncbi:MAG: metallophosphoesterase family protein [Pirellulaceae bacterium]|jgi:serine/threonine protein phosphatase 1|nr:metallophosphoesterase family protein [Pirellulaceae bacterium]
MVDRLIAVGDIHGCATALEAILKAIDLQPSDTFVTLGDYIDRGPESARVVELLTDLVGKCNFIPLMGNHELIFQKALTDPLQYRFWLNCGGDATLASYGGDIRNMPPNHMVFFENCRSYYESDNHILVHASYQHDLAMSEQSTDVMFWEHLNEEVPPPHQSGKKVIVGHTPQIDGEIYDLGHLLLLDTFCFGGKFLTAIELNSGQLWQADNYGKLR